MKIRFITGVHEYPRNVAMGLIRGKLAVEVKDEPELKKPEVKPKEKEEVKAEVEAVKKEEEKPEAEKVEIEGAQTEVKPAAKRTAKRR